MLLVLPDPQLAMEQSQPIKPNTKNWCILFSRIRATGLSVNTISTYSPIWPFLTPEFNERTVPNLEYRQNALFLKVRDRSSQVTAEEVGRETCKSRFAHARRDRSVKLEAGEVG